MGRGFRTIRYRSAASDTALGPDAIVVPAVSKVGLAMAPGGTGNPSQPDAGWLDRVDHCS